MLIISNKDDLVKIQLEEQIQIDVKQLNIDSKQLFIAIRNLGIQPDKVNFDFSGYDCPQKELELWIVDYLTTDIQVDIQQFNHEIALRIADFLDNWNPVDCSTYNGKYRDFALNNAGMILDIEHFLSSSIFYAASLAAHDSSLFHPETTMCPSCSANAMNLYSEIRLFEVNLMLRKYPACHYMFFDTDYGKKKLLQLAQTSMYALMLYGQTTPQWNLFQNLFRQLQSQCH